MLLISSLGHIWDFYGALNAYLSWNQGRQRFNVLGALNAVTHELITVTNDTYINAQSVCELLHKLAALGLCIPLRLFWTMLVIKVCLGV
jgi:ABC-type uncharacterized transport system YnjBCD substrate-binding protein